MAADPTVCCIMLTRDRPSMAARAVRAFRAQAYANKQIFMLDTGNESAGYFGDYDEVAHQWADLSLQSWSIGRLRNEAIGRAGAADIIAHFDDDDYSHPNRLTEQVALLQASGADCVGFNECLFWDTRGNGTNMVNCRETTEQGLKSFDATGQAWLYRCPSPTYGLGSSLLYWRSAWERKPLADINHGEDVRWITGLKVVGVSANHDVRTVAPVSGLMRWEVGDECEPRMICSIHGANTSTYAPEKDRNMWKRAADWDAYCQETMRL